METLANFTTTLPSNSTVTPPSSTSSLGFLWAGVAVLFFGSNFAPVKKYETGDGMFFQWILCSATFLVGVVVQIVQNSPEFHPIVMLGGVIWATGNICVVPIIKTIGMGLGMCIWGVTNLLSGWATARFGFFGLKSEEPSNPILNYVGVAVAVVSSLIFSLVKTEVKPIEMVEETEPLLSTTSPRARSEGSETLYANSSNHDILVFNNQRARNSINNPDTNSDESFIEKLSPFWQRIVGIVLSVLSGFAYGQTFTPSTYLIDRNNDSALNYVFACFVGIYVTSTVYFLLYIIIMKNKPRIYPKAILPGMISGFMWAAATTAWFVANKELSNAIAFPIVTTGPAIVASIWGVFVFKEIKGARNIGILLLAFAFVLTGVILVAFSK